MDGWRVVDYGSVRRSWRLCSWREGIDVMENRTRVASGDTVWIVDWDIPLGRDRYRFYRNLAKLKEELGLYGKMSSMSVLITADGDLAHRVYELATRYASRVNIYRGVKER